MNTLNQYKTQLKSLCFLILVPLIDVTYFIINNSKNGVHNLSTTFDYGLPFLKIFVIPYVIWYPFIFVGFIYICFKSREVYFKTLISFLISLICCYIIFYFFQTTTPRPELVGNDMLTAIIRIIYKADQPYNCFPSIHVLACYLIMRGMDSAVKGINKVKAVSGIISILIILSTMFIKQHVLMDVISGIFLGEIVFSLVKSLNLDRLIYILSGKESSEFV